MSLLGCNSKLLWHEIFFQIVDIIAVKQEKVGVIICRNFHLIHTELLEIFYSYMQQYNHSQTNIKIKFFILTEHISFIPTPIINASHILHIGRPSKKQYLEMAILNNMNINMNMNMNESKNKLFIQRISDTKPKFGLRNQSNQIQTNQCKDILNDIELEGILNIKEIRSFNLLDSSSEIPKDIFNIICDNIIKEINSPRILVFTNFRDTLYDILTYNLDMTECLWYILRYYIDNKQLSTTDISDILTKTYTFLKYYNRQRISIIHIAIKYFFFLGFFKPKIYFRLN
jgi:ERCC4-related helicase